MKWVAGLLITSALVLSACSNQSDSTSVQQGPEGSPSPTKLASMNGFEGRYRLEMEMPKPKEDDPMAEFAEAMAESMLDGSYLELRSGGQFSMKLMFDIEGEWKQEGEFLLLHPKKVMGMDVEEANKLNGTKESGFNEPMKLKPSSDGTLVAVNDPGKENEGTLRFIRDEKAGKG